VNATEQACAPVAVASGPLTLKQRVGRWLFQRLPITRFLFDMLRDEVAAWVVRAKNAWLPGRRRRLSRLRAARELYVNVACGPQVLPGFVNLDLHPAGRDVVAWDSRRSLPLSDGAARGIRAEQFVEHLETREELPAFLRDCHRALAPGGVLRVIVPDAERYLQAYCRPDLSGFRDLEVPDPFPGDLPTRMDVINHVFHQWHEHRWAYDFETLAHRLAAAGFATVQRSRFECSHDTRLAQDRDVHAPYSLYVEAIR
jgi:predicted SAM-dependent methyltransferase